MHLFCSWSHGLLFATSLIASRKISICHAHLQHLMSSQVCGLQNHGMLLAAYMSATPRHHAMLAVCCVEYYCFASTAVAVDSSHMTASSSALWSSCRFSPPSDFVNRQVSTMWFMVCRWPQSQEGDWVRPHLCKLARHGPWQRFIRDHVWRGRLKPGCRIIGSVTIVSLTTSTEWVVGTAALLVSAGDKFDKIHLHTADVPFNWRRRRFAECLLCRLGLV